MESAWQLFLRQLGSADPNFTYDEVCSWTADEFEALSGAHLIGESSPGNHVTCEACPDTQWERVRWSENGTGAFIACPECGPVEVNLERLRRWSIDVGRLAVMLAEALEIRQQPQPLASTRRRWYLGRRRFGGRFLDLFFSASPEEDFAAAITDVQQQLSTGGGLVIVPCSDARGDSRWGTSRLKSVALSHIATWKAGAIGLDLDVIEDLCVNDGADRKKLRIRSLTIPDRMRWEDVVIEVADTALTIGIRGQNKELSFREAGFSERDQRLETLKLLAAGRGQVAAERFSQVLSGKTPAKNRVNALRQVLQDLIPIDGSPIEHKKLVGMYVCAFRIRLAGETSFPTPPGTSWLDFRFVERRDGRLAVSVNEKRVFRAHQIERSSARRTEEVAEQQESVVRLYSLDEIGLRGEQGRITREGAVLVELLRGAGKLKRRGDDVDVLKLAEWLRIWTGLDGNPVPLSSV